MRGRANIEYSVLFSKENMRCEQVRGEGRPSYLLYFDNCACLRTRLRTRNQSIRRCVFILWVGHIHSGTGHDWLLCRPMCYNERVPPVPVHAEQLSRHNDCALVYFCNFGFTSSPNIFSFALKLNSITRAQRSRHFQRAEQGRVLLLARNLDDG